MTTLTEMTDGHTLTRQRELVWEAIRGGQWVTLGELAEVTGQPQASISARLRDFRKESFGSHKIERRYAGDGLFEYRRADEIQTEMAL
jgi:hypothetical protein